MIGLELLAALLFGLLLILGATVPHRSQKSIYELERQARANNKAAQLELNRTKFQADIVSLQMIKISGALVLFAASLVAAFGWLWGIVLAVAGAISYGPLARLSFIQSFAAKLYEAYESTVLEFVGKHQKIMWWLRWGNPKMVDTTLSSKDELKHLVEQAHSILSEHERKLIVQSLNFDQRQVKEVMTPRSMVRTIKKTELLGPLVLDDLHKSGHSRFPVIQGDIDHVVGTLYLRDVLTLDTARKHTATAETAMDKKVFYIKEDQTLTHALNAFLKTHHHLFIVVNEFRETVGILSLEDTMEALLGRKIVDEFDSHEDLRVVAERHPVSNQVSSSTKDV